MKITDVRIRKLFDEGSLRAIVSVTFDQCFAVHDIKVIDTEEKRLVAMPNRKKLAGGFWDVAHPISAAFRAELEEAVLTAYRKALEEAAERQDAADLPTPSL